MLHFFPVLTATNEIVFFKQTPLCRFPALVKFQLYLHVKKKVQLNLHLKIKVPMNLQINLFLHMKVHMKVKKRLQGRVHEGWGPSSEAHTPLLSSPAYQT